MKRYIIILLLLLMLPIQTKAIICSNDKKVGFQTMARNITTNYTYTEQDGGITFQITLSNIQEGLIVKDIKNNVTYPYRGSELTISGLAANTSYRFDIYTDDIYCDLEMLYSHYVNTPAYNPYYQDEVCIGMEEYPLCQKWTKMTLSYDKFIQAVENLKQSEKEIEPEQKKEENVKGIYDYILKFYLNYYYIVLPVFIVGGIVAIYYYNKKNDLF